MSFQISGLGHVRQPKVLDLTYDPVGLWRFDGSLIDLSPTGEDLSVDSGTLLYTASHEFGNRAAYFKDNLVRIIGTAPAPVPLRILGDVTVQVVCQFNGTIGADTFGTYIFGCIGDSVVSSTENTLYNLGLAGSLPGEMVPQFWWESPASTFNYVRDLTFHFGLGQWYHIVGVRESTGGGLSTGRLYVNGQLISEVASLIDAVDGSAARMTSGLDQSTANAGGWLGGMLSSAKVNNRALTAREIKYEWLRVSGEYAGDRL